MKTLAHVCPVLYEQLEYRDGYMNESIFDVIRDVSIDVSESMVGCYNGISQTNCLNSFVDVITDDGLCHTYNALNSHQIYTDA